MLLKQSAIDEINQAKQNRIDEINQAFSATDEEKETAKQFINDEAQKHSVKLIVLILMLMSIQLKILD